MDWDYILMKNCMTFVNMNWVDCVMSFWPKFVTFFYGYMICRDWILYIGSWFMFMLLYNVVLGNMLKWCDNMQSRLLDSLCLFKQLLELGLLACMDVDYCLRWNSWIIGLCHRNGSYKNLTFYVSWTQEQHKLLKSTALDLLSIEKVPSFPSKLLSIYLLFVCYF